MLADIPDDVAAKSVTDAFHDRGLDAIFYDMVASRLWIVQSKWSSRIDWKEVGEFLDGIRKLLSDEWSAFANNHKIYSRRNEIEAALNSSAKIVLVTVHNGPQPLDASSARRVHSVCEEIDGGSGLAEEIHWHQPHLLAAMQSESNPPPINADLSIAMWSEIKEPYHAFFGRIQGVAIAELWNASPHLSYLNLRDYSQRTDVNNAMAETVRNEPENFWYFNNGLTIICDSITPTVRGRLNHELTVVRLEGISLVNGAQTSGILADTIGQIPYDEQSKIWVQVRIIAVKKCPDGFAKRVTKFTNLQNAISVQDWVSLDPLQSRIASDFAVDRRRYAFRWGGSSDPTGMQGCTLKEATLALACAEPDMWFAVQAKREISVLWDTDSNRYKTLFHPNLTALRIWNAVRILRIVDEAVIARGMEDLDKAGSVSSHMQRLVLHMVFQDPRMSGWDTSQDVDLKIELSESIANQIFEKMRSHIATHHDKDYLAATCKSVEKCRGLVLALTSSGHRITQVKEGKSSSLPGQKTLFNDDDEP